ncbi:MAG TPA: potassium transporter TrkG [bacterium]|nr:potassium transporter TrkG [bacterium]
MNFPAITTILAALLGIVASFLLLPITVALWYGEYRESLLFAGVMLGTMALCAAAYFLYARRSIDALRRRDLTARDGFLAVTLSWSLAALVGALPFWLGGVIPSFTDAYFETMSGFTTTGASILTDVESFPRSMLFWRSFTHWLGGMGIVMLTVAIIPLLGIGGMQLLEAEAPGPTVDRLTPRIKETAKILWFLYLGFTVIETLLLMAGGMDLFDSLCHTFATLGTGGFSTKNASIGFYHSAYIDMVVTIFMLIGAMNFVLFYLLLRGRAREVAANSEFKAYVAIVLFSTLLIAAELTLRGVHPSMGESARFAVFQVASIISTTGFASEDFARWPHFSQIVLFFLMFVGGCAGSTGGGIKVIRLVSFYKLAFNEIRYLLHPRGVFTLTVDGRPVKKDAVYLMTGFFFIYIFFVLLTTLVVSTANVDLVTALTTSLATIGNIGPGLSLVGPMSNYAHYPDFIKWWLSFAMMVGRLEVYTVFVLFSAFFWRR